MQYGDMIQIPFIFFNLIYLCIYSFFTNYGEVVLERLVPRADWNTIWVVCRPYCIYMYIL